MHGVLLLPPAWVSSQQEIFTTAWVGGGGVGEEEGQKKGVHRIEPGSTDTSGYRPLHLQAYNSDGP